MHCPSLGSGDVSPLLLEITSTLIVIRVFPGDSFAEHVI
jgi:hypothetical protein